MSVYKPSCVFLLECDQTVAQTIGSLCARKNLSLRHFQCWDLMEIQLHMNTPCCLILEAHQDTREIKERITRITHAHNHLPVIVLGQQQNLTAAVASIQAGAIDYIEKPTISGRLAMHIENL